MSGECPDCGNTMCLCCKDTIDTSEYVMVHRNEYNRLAKQAEIISVLKDCVETIAECEVGETAAKLSSKATLKRVGILEAKYKGKE